MRDEELVRTPVYRNADYRWQKLGVTPDDLPFVATPVAVVLVLVGVLDVSFLWVLVTTALTLLFVILLKRGQPPDHLENLLLLLLAPRRLSHKARDDRQKAPFPIPRSAPSRQPPH